MQFFYLSKIKYNVNCFSVPLLHFLLLFLITACGFQLNRNQPVLVHNANLIAIKPIQNQTFTPNINSMLRESLQQKLASQKNIFIVSQIHAELIMEFSILTANIKTKKYSIDTTEYFSHTFKISGNFTLFDSRIKKNHFLNKMITGEHTLQNLDSEIGYITLQEGYEKAIINLSEKIQGYLLETF